MATNIDCFAIMHQIKNNNINDITEILDKNAGKDLEMIFKITTFVGNYEIVKLCLDYGVNIHIDNEYALINSIRYGHVNIVNLLLELGADIHTRSDKSLTEYDEYKSEYKLFEIISHYTSEVKPKEYALLWSIYNGKLDILKILIENGANINIYNNCILQVAVCARHYDVVQFLIKLDIFSQADINLALLNSINWRHIWESKIFYFLLTKVDFDEMVCQIFLKAIYFCNFEILQYCLDNGLDINFDYSRALSEAFKYYRYSVVSFLLNHNAYITDDIVTIAKQNNMMSLFNET